MLQFLDIVLTIVHMAIIVFNLFGWIPVKTRKAHFISVSLTAASWFLLGIWFGTGYCPFTDWQWEVKNHLGEKNLPSNFVEYMSEKILGLDFSSKLINSVIATCFSIAAFISIYVNFILPQIKQQ